MTSRTKKKYMKRKMAQAFGHQQKSIQCLIEVRELFNEWHPEWSPLFTGMCNNCVITMSFIKSLSIRAWGYFPETLSTWLR